MIDLTTVEGILEWVATSLYECPWIDRREAEETAAWLAECVRLRVAYDAGYNPENFEGLDVERALETYYDGLWEAMMEKKL